MLIVLGLVVGLLFVAPALLLWTGRLINANTDPRARPFRLTEVELPAQSVSGSIHRKGDDGGTPWFKRPMLPAFGNAEPQD